VAALRTIGHGELSADELGLLLTDAGVEVVVDVRRRPASRRHPQFSRTDLQRWLPEYGLDYQWVEPLGGHRKAAPGSPNLGLGDPALRGYADHMASPAFTLALDGLVAEDRPLAIMCAERDWRRCHRRLLADALVHLRRTAVEHLTHDGEIEPHRPSPAARVADGRLVYDLGTTRSLY
jgi:uncharacterized protein (DUF488 family)